MQTRYIIKNSAHTVDMKKLIFVTLLATSLALPTVLGNSKATSEPCKAIYVCDAESGQVVESYQEEEQLPIASMCKVMTLLLGFEAIERGDLTLDEQITVSQHAAGMGGSQVFLQENLSYPTAELLKSIAVCSANDSCVAIAERIAGTESAFIDAMNQRAKELGADNTLFANCTGLPLEPQYSCAKDVSIMFRELLKHKQYFEYSKIWLEDFSHPDGRITSMTNTNKLIRKLDGCDGGKTGFTNQAGFCLAATVKKNDTRLICVVIGATTSDERFRIVSDCTNCAFAAYENRIIAQADRALDETIPVRSGKVKEIAICPSRSLSIFTKKNQEIEGISTNILIDSQVRAPISKGDCLGEMILYRDGVEISRCDLIAMDDVERFSYFGAFRETSKYWN